MVYVSQISTYDNNFLNNKDSIVSPLQINLYYNLAHLPNFVRHVCEIGFKVGYSAFVWLNAYPDIKVIVFSKRYSRYSKKYAGFLQKMFAKRFIIEFGDPRLKMPRFLLNHPGFKCQVVIIDVNRFHGAPAEDFKHMRQMVDLKQHVLILENIPSVRGQKTNFEPVWKKNLQQKIVDEFFNCSNDRYTPGRLHTGGFTVGRYL